MITRRLARFEVRSFRFARDRVIGDAFVSADTNHVATLTLWDANGQSGLGFFDALFAPLPPRAWLQAHIAATLWPALEHHSPEGLLHRITLPRAGHGTAPPFGIADAFDQALWDLAAKRAGQPLWRYLGGTSGEADAYASGLCFHLTDTTAHAFYAVARADGHRAYKVKLGHPDLGRDLARLALVQDAVGPNAILMADANEAWTVAETRRRIRAFAGAGHALYWIEDPIARADTAGLASLRGTLGNTLLNAGEYLGEDGRHALLAAGATDIVPVHDNISQALRIARAAAAHGLPVTVGNTSMNLGAHLAAALPHVDRIEDSRLNTSAILARPLAVIDGRFQLPDTPGHGLELAPDADRHEVQD